MLRVLHVVALTFASGRSEVSTSKSLLQKERSDKVDLFGSKQTREWQDTYVGGNRTTCGDDRVSPLPWLIRNVM